MGETMKDISYNSTSHEAELSEGEKGQASSDYCLPNGSPHCQLHEDCCQSKVKTH